VRSVGRAVGGMTRREEEEEGDSHRYEWLGAVWRGGGRERAVAFTLERARTYTGSSIDILYACTCDCQTPKFPDKRVAITEPDGIYCK
jgi:hypothetical protein